MIPEVTLLLQPVEQTTQAGQWKPSQVTHPMRIEQSLWGREEVGSLKKILSSGWIPPGWLRGFRPGFVCLGTTVSPGRVPQRAACLPAECPGLFRSCSQQASGPPQWSWFKAQHFRSWLLLCIQNPTHSIHMAHPKVTFPEKSSLNVKIYHPQNSSYVLIVMHNVFIGGYLLYSVVLLSAVQQHESVCVCVCVCVLPFKPAPHPTPPVITEPWAELLVL